MPGRFADVSTPGNSSFAHTFPVVLTVALFTMGIASTAGVLFAMLVRSSGMHSATSSGVVAFSLLGCACLLALSMRVVDWRATLSRPGISTVVSLTFVGLMAADPLANGVLSVWLFAPFLSLMMAGSAICVRQHGVRAADRSLALMSVFGLLIGLTAVVSWSIEPERTGVLTELVTLVLANVCLMALIVQDERRRVAGLDEAERRYRLCQRALLIFCVAQAISFLLQPLRPNAMVESGSQHALLTAGASALLYLIGSARLSQRYMINATAVFFTCVVLSALGGDRLLLGWLPVAAWIISLALKPNKAYWLLIGWIGLMMAGLLDHLPPELLIQASITTTALMGLIAFLRHGNGLPDTRYQALDADAVSHALAKSRTRTLALLLMLLVLIAAINEVRFRKVSDDDARELMQSIDIVSARLGDRINGLGLILAALEPLMVHGTASASQFSEVARGALSALGSGDTIEIQWAPDYRLQHSEPRGLPAFVRGIDLRDHPANGPQIRQIIDQGVAAWDGPFTKAEGGQAIAYYLPLRAPVQEHGGADASIAEGGLLLGLMHLPDALSDVLDSVPNRYLLSVWFSDRGDQWTRIWNSPNDHRDAQTLWQSSEFGTNLNGPDQVEALRVRVLMATRGPAVQRFDASTGLMVTLATLIAFLAQQYFLRHQLQSADARTRKLIDSANVLVNHSVIPMATFDDQKHCLFVNQAMLDFAGAPSVEAFINRSKPGDTIRWQGLEHTELWNTASATLDDGVERTVTLNTLDSGGRKRIGRMYFQRLDLAEEQQLLVQYLDQSAVDDRQGASQQRVNSGKSAEAANARQRDMSTVISNIAHDLRTPLNAVIACGSLLQNGDLNGENRDHAGTILEAGQYMLRLLNDLLDIAKIESGALSIECEPFNLREELEAVTGVMRVNARAKGLMLDLAALPMSLPLYRKGDAKRLRQILFNLIGNAIKFTEQGSVTLSVMPVDNGDPTRQAVRIIVNDTGIGISEIEQAQLFSRFVQVCDGARNSYGGTGLGLAIVRELAERMGGSVSVTSQLHKGSSFTVELPLEIDDSPEPRKPLLEQSFRGSRLRGLKILLVDDSTLNLKVTAALLEREGARVEQACDGGEALAILKGQNAAFDLIITDIVMPVMDGIELSRTVREDPAMRRLPVLAVTGLAERHERDAALAAGAGDCLLKPVEPEQLISAVHALLPDFALQRSQATRAEHWPVIDGINNAAARDRFADDWQGYRSILERMTATFDSLTRHLAHLDEGNLLDLGSALRSLQGAAQHVCAFNLARLAGQTLQAISQSHYDDIPALLSELTTVMRSLRKAVDEEVQNQPQSGPHASASSIQLVSLELVSLREELLTSQIKAVDRYHRLKPLLANPEDLQVKELDAAIESLDFERAARLVTLLNVEFLAGTVAATSVKGQRQRLQ